MTSTSKRWNQIRFHDRIVKFSNFVFPQIDILERDVLKQNLRSFLTSWWIQRTQIKIGFKGGMGRTPQCCDIYFFYHNKIKCNFIVSLPRFLPYRVAQWVKGITTNLLVMNLNSARNSKTIFFSKNF